MPRCTIKAYKQKSATWREEEHDAIFFNSLSYHTHFSKRSVWYFY